VEKVKFQVVIAKFIIAVHVRMINAMLVFEGIRIHKEISYIEDMSQASAQA
jgi:hypothetical protein